MSSTSLGKSPRILAFVPTDSTPLQAKFAADAVQQDFRDKFGAEVAVVDSIRWYREQIGRCADFDTWVWETVSGRDYNTRDPHFTGFVACTAPLDRNAASVVALALTNERVVLRWEENTPLARVVGLVKTDQAGKAAWQLNTVRF